MKALFILLLLVGVGYASYQYAYQPLVVDTLGLSKPAPKVVEEDVPEKKIPEPIVIKEKEEPKLVAKPVLAAAETTPAITVPQGLGRQGKEANGFQPPEFPSIEQTTKNWTELPSSFFAQHQEVTLKKAVALKDGATETTTLQPGSNAVAVAQNGMNVVVGSDTAKGKAEVALDDTDIKQRISEIYSRWKIARTDELRREFANAKVVAEKDAQFGKKKVIAGPVNNNKPSRNSDGSYAVCIDSMKAGQVREITPQNIKKWGELQQETIDGKDYWTVVVNYSTKTMFGDFDVEAQARIFNGKVEKWVYTGSGEVVP